MRRWVLLIVASAAFTGCKALNRDKPRDDRAAADPASRGKSAPKPGTDWLDAPGPARADVPPADSWANPRDPNYNVDREVRGLLAGFVEDPDGRKRRDVYVEIVPANDTSGGAPIVVQTDRQGYFMVKGLKSKQTYILTVRAKSESGDMAGRVYAQVPKQYIRIPLIEGLVLPGGPATPAPGRNDRPAPSPSGATPPGAAIPPPVLPSGGVALPEPIPHTGEGTGLQLPDTPPRIDAPPRSPARPDLVAPGPDGLNRPPVTNIPNRSQSRSIKPRGEFVLYDTLNVPREFPARGLVLLDFMTTSCLPCQKSEPTLRALQARHALHGFEVVGVACDEARLPQRRAVAAAYQKAHDLNYLLYVEPGDEPGTLMKRFGVQSFPTLVLIDETGRTLWKGHPRDAAELERIIKARITR
jgi:thiol-disulfide isomerase/thioredoxin